MEIAELGGILTACVAGSLLAHFGYGRDWTLEFTSRRCKIQGLNDGLRCGLYVFACWKAKIESHSFIVLCLAREDGLFQGIAQVKNHEDRLSENGRKRTARLKF